ncbi:MAG: hypothetical protein ACYSUQ_07270 [Planctomycetota bacterium]|jgi:hypothetical protein
MAALNAIAESSPTPAATSSADARLGDAADRVVGATFYGTLLRTLRSSSLRGEYGHGGRGEEVFQAQLDQIFAEQAGRARNFDLSKVIARTYRAQQEAIDRISKDNGGAG